MNTTEVFCPLCKSNSYINPNIKIFVSPCYHSICEMCVSRLFSRGSNKCPECEVILRKSSYTTQTFEDVGVERECRVRRLLSVHARKTLEDFSDEEDYNEYLEKTEELVSEMVQLQDPREISMKMQEAKEMLSRETQQKRTESAKRRKTGEQEEIPREKELRKLQYLYPPSAIDPETVPEQMYYGKNLNRWAYRDLLTVLIKKASASLKQQDI